jgi:hypothetical protein
MQIKCWEMPLSVSIRLYGKSVLHSRAALATAVNTIYALFAVDSVTPTLSSLNSLSSHIFYNGDPTLAER